MLTVPLITPRFRPCPTRAGIDRDVDDVVAAAARAEVGAAESLRVCVEL